MPGPSKACMESYKAAVIQWPLTLVRELKFLASSKEQFKSPNLSTQVDTRWVIAQEERMHLAASRSPWHTLNKEHGERGGHLSPLVYLKVVWPSRTIMKLEGHSQTYNV